MAVLVTGGAGYIGSHTAVALHQAGRDVVIVDNFANSSPAAVDAVRALTTSDLVNSDNTFFSATGVTSGELLEGVRFGSHYVHTNSIVLRSKTGTVRYMSAIHRVEELRDLANFEL